MKIKQTTKNDEKYLSSSYKFLNFFFFFLHFNKILQFCCICGSFRCYQRYFFVMRSYRMLRIINKLTERKPQHILITSFRSFAIYIHDFILAEKGYHYTKDFSRWKKNLCELKFSTKYSLIVSHSSVRRCGWQYQKQN